ncbi:MAG TPA: VOC family protein [Pseudonocardiaceae bacterium]|nr:VOC family protein [Pseudonocardiaceae bacterium]
MASRLNPYLSFGDDARPAMEFYHSVFGGTLVLNTFGDLHAAQEPAENDLIMHGMLETTSGFTLMGSDTSTRVQRTVGNNITISLSGDDGEELRGYWTKLSEGGEVTMELQKQMWGDEFGMCTDKFGIGWMVDISQPQQ